MRKTVVTLILLLSGLMGAVLSGLGGYALSVFAGSPYPTPGTVALMVPGLGFIAGVGATLMWQFSGADFGNPRDYVKDHSDRERWSHAVPYSAVLGAFSGFSVFVAANLPKPQFSLILVAHVLAFVIVAEGAMILGRGFNWVLGSVSRRE